MSGADTAVPTSPTAGMTETRNRGVGETPPSTIRSVTPEWSDEDEAFFSVEKFDLSKATAQMHSALDPGAILGEQFRILRTRLSLMQKQNGIRTILVTSTVPQEGKSFTSCALAGVFAREHKKRVVIIDADLRKYGSGRDYGIDGNTGVCGTAQVLQGTSEFQKSLLKSDDPEFWFLPSGTLPNNPSELLSAPQMEKTIRLAAEKFDWVIVDGPPALALADPCLIAPLCDTVILVVRANSTPVKLIKETIHKISYKRICGIVLNRQKLTHSSRYYYKDYYHKHK